MNLFDVQFDGAGNAHYSPNSTTIPDSDPPCDAIDPNDLIDDEWSEPAQEGFSLRPYQHEAVKRIEAELYGATGKGDALSTDPHNSSLLVMATGLGKTVIVSEVVKRRKPGKALMIAHRGELIYQAKTTLESLCGEPVTVEMADRYARMDQNIVVATVQTLIAGMGGDGRMVAFDPNDFSLLVTDECATGDTLITLADGETRSIREIYDANRQVQVMSVNQVGDVVPATVVGRKRSVSHRIVSVVLSDGTTIRCTRDHLFFTNNGFLPASLLTQEHIVLKYRHEQPTKTTSVRKSAWGRTYASLRAMSSSPLYCSAVCQTVCIRDGKIRDSEGADEKRSEAGTKRRMGWADNELQHLEQPDIFSGAFPLFSTRQENGNGGMARFDCRARFGVVVHGRRLADQGRGSTFNRKLLSERTSCDCSLVQDTLGLDGTCAAVKKQSFPSSTQQGRRQNLLHDHRAAYDPIYAVQALSALLGDMPSLRSGISPQKQQPSQPGVLLQVRMPGDLRQCPRRGILPETSGASVGQDSQTKAGNAGIETLHDMRRGIPDKQETQGDLWQGGMREGAEAKLSPTLLFGKPATNLTQCRVVSVEEEAGGGEVEVFDLEVRGNHNYFANGLLVHNCHHGLAASYGRIYKYFHQNPNLKHLGVTATPDRADEEALGKVYESVAMTYEIADAIHDGWLVPIKAVPVHIAGLDYSTIRTTAGDLNGADLANVMEQEAPLHEMVQAIVEVVSQAPKGSLAKALEKEDDAGFADEMAVFASQHPTRKTLIFAASVAHAERLSEILNRWLPGRATWVCGGTPKDTRKQLFADYKSGRYAFLVNVGVCTEGWDEPSIEVVVMARPTKSRALYTQMLGRGTRALPGVVDGPATPEARIEAIAASGKTHIVCVDFVGNCGRHTLMTPADILGGNYENDVVDLAKQIVEKSDGRPVDIDEALEQAKKQREEEKAREAARRAKVRVGAKYEIGYAIDPFELFKVNKFRERGWEKGKPVTDKMKAMLERQKIWRDDMSYSEARQLVQGMAERRTKGLCTFRQANALCKRGLPPNVSFETAHRWMDSIAANRWSVPSEVTKEAQELLR